MDVKELHHRTVEAFGARVEGAPPGSGPWPTPCDEWSVRALVNHLVYENRWTAPLLAGATVDEVGDRFEGDLLGDDPLGAWAASASEAVAAAASVDPAATVHLSFGDFPAEEYLRQLAADHLVHAWDLATATGQPAELDGELVDEVLGWFRDRERFYRDGGVIGPAVAMPLPDGAGAQAELIARFGRDPSPSATLAAVARFNAAFARCDLRGIGAAVTPDCVFADTTPPDGVQHRGPDAVAAAFAGVFATPGAAFETEEGFTAGDRAVFRWRYAWRDGHVSGVDVFRVRDGLVAEKLSYVKG